MILKHSLGLQHTAELNKRRLRVEDARKHWLQKHRKLFEPLLPENNTYFTTLEKELRKVKGAEVYVPLHEIEEQPSLIQGGEMKDYQVSRSWLLAYLGFGTHCYVAPRTVVPGMDV